MLKGPFWSDLHHVPEIIQLLALGLSSSVKPFSCREQQHLSLNFAWSMDSSGEPVQDNLDFLDGHIYERDGQDRTISTMAY